MNTSFFGYKNSDLNHAHAVVFEKSTGRKGRGSEDTHPTDFFAANQRAQAEIESDRHADRKQRTDKLPGGKPKKDGLLIIPDFLWHFYFDIASLLLGLQPQQFLDDPVAHPHGPHQDKQVKD
ncbi:Uncharacterised protein [uncultured Ruminococcus sp.]|nr:Uncharacterised protein [uncultured Ruminococcus sp.]